MKFYLIGIKGSGMASLFCMLKDDGYEVIGSDVDYHIYTEEILQQRKAVILPLSDKTYLNNCFVIIGHDFIEPYIISDLKKNNIPYLEYHKFLNFYINKNKLVSIAGSHGKTTLTSLLAHSINSSYLIGNGNGKMDNNSKYFFLESCEYKNHYHIYNPNFIIITNIDYDHVDYFVTKDEYNLSFKKFANKVNKGLIEYNSAKKINNPYFFTYGLDDKADFHLKKYKIDEEGISGILYFQNRYITSFKFKKLYGYPLLMDIVALLSFHYLENNNLETIKNRLETYEMTNKRFNILNINDIIVIEDYAHHPTQIKENFNTLKSIYKNNKLIAVFKPDRPSRIEYFIKEFKNSLSLFDKAYILPFNNDENNDLLAELQTDKITFIKDEKSIKVDGNNIYILMSSKSLENVKEHIKSSQ